MWFEDMYKKWLGMQPKLQDVAEAFPAEFQKWAKGKIKALKKELPKRRIMLRDWKNKQTNARSNGMFYTPGIRSIENRILEINQEIARLEWLISGKANRSTIDIERAKQHPIPQLLEIKRKTALCPWHEDRNPSLHYYDKTNTVHCFSCGKGGDAIDVAQAIWETDFKDTVRRLTNS